MDLLFTTRVFTKPIPVGTRQFVAKLIIIYFNYNYLPTECDCCTVIVGNYKRAFLIRPVTRLYDEIRLTRILQMTSGTLSVDCVSSWRMETPDDKEDSFLMQSRLHERRLRPALRPRRSCCCGHAAVESLIAR